MAKSDFWLSIYSVVAAQFEREGIGSEDKKLKERGGSLQSLPFQIGPLTGQTKMTRSPRVYHAINTRWLTQNGAKMTQREVKMLKVGCTAERLIKIRLTFRAKALRQRETYVVVNRNIKRLVYCRYGYFDLYLCTAYAAHCVLACVQTLVSGD